MNRPLASPSNRVCPFCAEAIGVAAKVCPRCRQWLTWRSLRHPTVGVCLMMVASILYFGAFGAALIKALTWTWNPPPYYTDFHNALQVTESRRRWTEADDGPRIYVTGILTNVSTVAWSGVEFECRFFNESGALVDAASSRGRVTIGAHDDAAFRATVVPTAGSNEYRSFRISVSTARSPRGLL